MGIKKVIPYNFRNLRNQQEIDLNSSEVFLVGDNGQGKTNFIESCYLLCIGSSFRSRQHNRIIRYDEKSTSVQGLITEVSAAKDDGRNVLQETIDRHVTIQIERNGKKSISVDSKLINDRKILIEGTPCIVFCHEDIAYVRGSPEKRRQFFDQTLSFFDAVYIDLYRAYRRILRERNEALKTGAHDLIDIYDEQMANYGIELQKRRFECVQKFNSSFGILFKTISRIEEELSIKYRPSWDSVDETADAIRLLQNNRRKDVLHMTTTSGPHRDDFVFEMKEKNFARYASTGQTRLCSLVLRVAQSNFILVETGKRPILLIDDVLLELDQKKRSAFIQNLPSYEQILFTFLPDENFLAFRQRDTLVYFVEDGVLTPWKKQMQS